MFAKVKRTALSVAVGSSIMLGGVAAATAAGVTLTIWHNTQDTQGVLALYKAYEKASGNTLSFVDIPADGFETATLTKWASGDRPDILEYHPGQADLDHFNPSQTMVDLSNEAFVKQSSIYDIGGRASDGKVYAAITTFPETWGVYYNKKLLADHGLQPATTFAELKAQCAVLSKAGVTTMHEAGSSGWPVAVEPLLYASTIARPGYVADVMAHKAKFNDPDSPLLAGFQDWADRKAAGCFNSDMTTATFEQGAKAVYEGKAAYQMIHSNIAAVYLDEAGGDKAKLDEKVGFLGVGAKEQKTTVDAGPIGTYMVPKTGDSAKEAAALDFIRYVTGPGYADYIQTSGTFPIVNGVPGPKASELLKQIKAAYDKGPRVVLINQNVPGGFSNLMQVSSETTVGQLTPKQAADQMQQGVVEAAQAQGLSGW
jgi:raffinose/stachyose/melibiose transport system substrate-binding protein